MIGAIAPDVIGSVYEHSPIKTKDFPLFHPEYRYTDDSVVTIAVAKAILEDRNYRKSL
jgi:ADP-ribosylglycohydrolase